MNSQVISIPALWGEKFSQQLTFTDNGLHIEKTFPATSIDSLEWQNVQGIQVKSITIKGLYLALGQQFIISLKTDTEQVYAIKLTSYFGVKSKAYERLWVEIFKALYKFHFNAVVSYYCELQAIGQVFNLSGVNVHNDGVSWGNRPKLLWDELEVNAYSKYFVIRNRLGIQRRKFLYYGEDWNACLLLDLLKHFIKVQTENLPRRRTQK